MKACKGSLSLSPLQLLQAWSAWVHLPRLVSIIYQEADMQAHTFYFSYNVPINPLQFNSLEVFQWDFPVPQERCTALRLPVGSCTQISG